jgi:hypothetical protein
VTEKVVDEVVGSGSAGEVDCIGSSAACEKHSDLATVTIVF